MKLFVNRAPVHGPWGGGAQFVNNFYKIAVLNGHQILHVKDIMTDPPDVILLAGIDSDQLGVSAINAIGIKAAWKGKHNVSIIARINECDARKGTNHIDNTLINLSPHFDKTIFVSKWLMNYFKPSWKCKNNTIIYNGVDGDIFKPIISLPHVKTRIVTHHWSNNFMKGFDIYQKIDELVGEDDNFEFTYIGRERGTFHHTNVIAPISGPALGLALADHDVYVSASRWDPGPNHVLESLSCHLPTYVHIDGGGAVEFAGEDHVFNTDSELLTLLRSRSFKPNTMQLASWHECAQSYILCMEQK